MRKLIYILLHISITGFGQTTYHISQDDVSADYTDYGALITAVGTLSSGDSILFRAGETWRDEYTISESGSEGDYIYFGRYGEGRNPRFLGSRKEPSWSASGTANVWQSSSSDYSSGWFDNYYAARIFFMENDSAAWGDLQTYSSGFTNLTEEYDFTYNGGRVYVYSTTDPDNAYDSIEVTVRSRIWSFSDGETESYLIFDGIDMKFPRLSCFYSGYPEVRGATDLIFRNCTIGYVGYKGSGYAYGIEAFHTNFLVENCSFSDCGRRAISFNLYDGTKSQAEACDISNVIVRNNVFKRGYHTTSLDLSAQQGSYDTILGVYFYNNIVDDHEVDEMGDWVPSNQIFIQNGEDHCYINEVYVVGNLFVHSTGANILFEGSDTSYVYNNTIIGHNPLLTEEPQVNVVWQYGFGVGYYRNNILYDNLPNNSLRNQGVQQYYAEDGEGNPVHDYIFGEKDYNLYYQDYPGVAGGDRNFSCHRVNNTGGNGYWDITEWSDYLTENASAGFESHSPTPQLPDFTDYSGMDFSLSDESPAVASGLATDWVIVSDPFSVSDTINKYGLNELAYNTSDWDMGAYVYTEAQASSDANITAFSLFEQTGAATINTGNHTVSIEVAYGTNVTSLSPTISVSSGATIDPTSGTAQNFTSPVTYTVTAEDAVTEQEWTVTVTVAAAPSPTGVKKIYTIGGVKQIYWIDSTPYIITVNE